MKRFAITIIYNGLHHLKHKGFAEFMAKNFDVWVVVEGHSKAGGSTSWCHNLKVSPTSKDGTVEFMRQFALDNPNVTFWSRGAYWRSKDEMVNSAIKLLKRKENFGYLWQVDADEHWTVEGLEEAERQLIESGKRQAAFQFNHYVGKDLIAVGDWGSGWVNRLFLWRGQRFISHEPSLMDTHNRTVAIEGVKFDHYSYYFEQDIKWKEQYYPDCEGIFDNWSLLPNKATFPQPISALFNAKNPISKSKSQIIKL